MTQKMVTLRMCGGWLDEVSFNDQRYAVDPVTKEVTLPFEAALGLIRSGGAELLEPVETPMVPEGLQVRVKHQSPAASCSFGGISYGADASGCIVVPFAAMEELQAHGWQFVSEA